MYLYMYGTYTQFLKKDISLGELKKIFVTEWPQLQVLGVQSLHLKSE